VNLSITLWAGVYWDESGFGRSCVLVMLGDHVLSALDTETREPLLDPDSAIPLVPDTS
jgi:hypothetical protein